MLKNKHINVIIACVVLIAVTFTIIFTYFPELFPIKKTDNSISTEYVSKVFTEDKILDIDIKMDDDEWNEMLKNATNEEYVNCNVVINGVTFKNVAIRPKGNSTLNQVASTDSPNRFSFKLEFDHYNENQTLYGLDKLVLNNCMSDTTYMKEYLSYDLMDFMGVKTPLKTYANISVNGESFGLYLALEGMEESFAIRNYGNNYGQLYKPESMQMGGGIQDGQNGKQNGFRFHRGQDVPSNFYEYGMTNYGNYEDTDNGAYNDYYSNVDRDNPFRDDENQKGFMGNTSSSNGMDLKYTDDDLDSYRVLFDSAVFDSNNFDYRRVVKALKNLNNGTNLEKYIDVDATVRYCAVNTVLINFDSYFGSLKHNYYLYEKDGKLTMLPWDYNLAFAGFQVNDASTAINYPIDTPVSGTTLEERPMIGKLLAVDEYKDLYHGYLDEIVTNYFECGRFENTIEKINNLISDKVENDPTAFTTFEQYTSGIKTLKEFGLLRAESIKGQLNGTIPSTEEDQLANPKQLVDASSIDLSTMGSQGGGMNKGMMHFVNNMPGVKANQNENETNNSVSEDKGQNAGDGQMQDNGPGAGDGQMQGNGPGAGDGQMQGNGPGAGDGQMQRYGPMQYNGFMNGPGQMDKNQQNLNNKANIRYLITIIICFAVIILSLIFVKIFSRKRYRA